VLIGENFAGDQAPNDITDCQVGASRHHRFPKYLHPPSTAPPPPPSGPWHSCFVACSWVTFWGGQECNPRANPHLRLF
jgi:hypothetical protein